MAVFPMNEGGSYSRNGKKYCVKSGGTGGLLTMPEKL